MHTTTVFDRNQLFELIEDMPNDKIEQVKQLICLHKKILDGKISEMKRHRYETGEMANQQYFNAVVKESKHLGRCVQLIQNVQSSQKGQLAC